MVFLQNIKIEGGFLNGLDLTFEKGLNVIIGARGVGKTSLIEIIRYCLGVESYSIETREKSINHVLAVLADGIVHITLFENNEKIIVQRRAGDSITKRSAEYGLPIILSQNEIEKIGLETRGRLKIIDDFIESQKSYDERERQLIGYIRSITVEMQGISLEIEQIKSQIIEFTNAPIELDKAIKEEETFTKSIKGSVKEQAELKRLSDKITAFSIQDRFYERTLFTLDKWHTKIKELLINKPNIESLPKSLEIDENIKNINSKIAESVNLIQDSERLIKSTRDFIINLRRDWEKDNIQLTQTESQLRQQLDKLKRGAGELSRKVSELKEKNGQLIALNHSVKEKTNNMLRIQNDRKKYLNSLENLRSEKWKIRNEVATTINNVLGPNVKINVERSALNLEYENALSNALRGSGLKYNIISPLIAARVSPKELVEAIELNSPEAISELTDMSLDRTTRLLDYLRESNIEDILTAKLDDGVKINLLDGIEYKSTENLSTGQRCTSILPILLFHKNKSLIVDQPEDNLDNAFIVNTLITAILNCKSDSQLIFSSHNANIPVLGEAEKIIVLDSDGKRGFIKCQGSLESNDVVKAITTIMEGGFEAFMKRAEFYRKKLGGRT